MMVLTQKDPELSFRSMLSVQPETFAAGNVTFEMSVGLVGLQANLPFSSRQPCQLKERWISSSPPTLKVLVPPV